MEALDVVAVNIIANLSQIKKMKQVIKTFSMRMLVAYRIGIRQYWCKKEGNKGLIRR